MTAEPVGRSRPVVPGWLRNVAAIGWRVLVSVALGAVVLTIAGELMTVTASILVAVIVSATFAPFVLQLRARGWSRTKAAAVVTLGAVLVIFATLVLITFAFLPYVPQVVAAIEAGVAAVREAMSDASVPPETITAAQGAFETAKGSAADSASSLVGIIANAFTIGLFSLFLTFFFLQDGDKAWAWAFQATTGDARQRFGASGHDALERVGGYLRGTAILAAVNAVSSFVFLWLLGVPLAAPLAVLVFFGGFIPYIGGFITTGIMVLVTLSTQGGTAVIVLLALIAIRNTITGNFLRPIVYGKTVNIHPAVVLAALPAGAALAGIVGLFVAIPVVAIILAVSGAVVSILDPGPQYEPPALVPGWLDRLAQWSWRLLVIVALGVAAIGLLVLIPVVAISVVLAIVFAATIRPLVLALVRRGWHRGPAAALATGGTLLVVIFIVTLAVILLGAQAGQIASTSSTGAESVNDASGGALGPLAAAVDAYGLGFVAAVASVLEAIAGISVVLILSGLLCFYFLLDGDKFWNLVRARIPDDRANEVDGAANRAIGVLSGYMVGTGAISIFGAATQFLIMVLLGLPLALPLAVLSFFGGFIPYIGSFVTTGLALLVAIAVGTPEQIAIMAIFTGVFNIVQGNFVAPLVYGRAVNLHPAIVLMAIPAGSEIAGILGMFLAVPFLGVIAATWRTVLRAFATHFDAMPGEPATAVPTATAMPPLDPASEPTSG